jgi:hypothetical protein
MNGMIAPADLYDDPLDPGTVDFTTKPGRKCRTCYFSRQKSAVCDEAVRLALRAGMDSCDDSDVVYVVKVRDPRQIAIE